MSVIREFTLADASAPFVDAFGRLRVSNPVTRFDAQLTYDLQPILLEEDLAGSGSIAHDANGRFATLSVTAVASDKAALQSYEHIPYTPGKSFLVKLTGSLGSAATGVTQRIGLFDDSDGMFFERTSTGTIRVVIRSSVSGSVVDTGVAQSSWNMDPMDGSGPSEKTLDDDTSQIFVIDGQSLYQGQVRFGFGFEGSVIYVHSVDHVNVQTVPYIATANLPVRYEIETDGTSAGSMQALCMEVSSEGGTSTQQAFAFSEDMGTTLGGVTAVNSPLPLISIRPRATFNSIVNRTRVELTGISVITSSDTIVELFYGSTLTGASWADVDTTNSTVQADTSATSFTGGIKVGSAYVASSGTFVLARELRYPFALDASGAHPTTPLTDSYTLAARRIQTNANVGCAFDWRELR